MTGALLEEPIAGPAEIAAFAALHRHALEAHEARHNMILGRLMAAETSRPPPLRLWTLGGPGQCAVQVARRHIVLGDLDRDQCRALASLAGNTDYAGVVGADDMARWFAESAMERGERFDEPMPQTILALSDDPRFPVAPGVPRPATVEDVSLLHDWLLAFGHEAVPHDPLPARQDVEREAATGRYLLWTVEGEPVALAGQARHTAPGDGDRAGLYAAASARARLCGIGHRHARCARPCAGKIARVPLRGRAQSILQPMLCADRLPAGLSVMALPA